MQCALLAFSSKVCWQKTANLRVEQRQLNAKQCKHHPPLAHTYPGKLRSSPALQACIKTHLQFSAVLSAGQTRLHFSKPELLFRRNPYDTADRAVAGADAGLRDDSAAIAMWHAIAIADVFPRSRQKKRHASFPACRVSSEHRIPPVIQLSRFRVPESVWRTDQFPGELPAAPLHLRVSAAPTGSIDQPVSFHPASYREW